MSGGEASVLGATQPRVRPPSRPVSAGKVLRRVFAFVVAAILAPALVGLAAGALSAVPGTAGSSQPSDLGMLWFLPLFAVVCGAPGSALFGAPWLFVAPRLRLLAPGRLAWSLAGAGAGLTYLAVAALESVLRGPGSGGAQGLLAMILGTWPAVTAFHDLWRLDFDPLSVLLVVTPPFAGAVAGWAYARIAGEG